MVVAKNVYSGDGLLLLGANTLLTDNYIARLCALDISSVDIVTTCLECGELPEAVEAETRRKLVFAVRDAFREFQATKKIDGDLIFSSVESIVGEVLHNRHAMIHLADIHTYDNYTFHHSVNVGIMATMIGIHLGYEEWRLKQLALGSILHDIGKMLVPVAILHKPERLNEEEMAEMRQHTDYGFELLRKQKFVIPLPASHVAYQHHEKYDGSGYLRQLGGNEIHEYARVAAIADVYDALTSDRPYRRGLLPHQAYEVLQSLAGRHFDPVVLEAFTQRIAPYPPGTVVQTNGGQIGVVVRIQPGLAIRPVIRLLLNEHGKRYDDEKILDLTRELTAFIIKVYDGAEAMEVDRLLANPEMKS